MSRRFSVPLAIHPSLWPGPRQQLVFWFLLLLISLSHTGFFIGGIILYFLVSVFFHLMILVFLLLRAACYTYTPPLFILSLLMGIWVVVSFWPLWADLCECLCKNICVDMFSLFLGKARSEVVGSYTRYMLKLLRKYQTVFTEWHHFTFPASVCENSRGITPCQ